MAFNRILDFSNGLDFYLGFFFSTIPATRNAISLQLRNLCSRYILTHIKNLPLRYKLLPAPPPARPQSFPAATGKTSILPGTTKSFPAATGKTSILPLRSGKK